MRASDIYDKDGLEYIRNVLKMFSGKKKAKVTNMGKKTPVDKQV